MKTPHFVKRSQQRGVGSDVLLLIELFGRESKNILRRKAVGLRRCEVGKIQSDLKRLIRLLEEHKNTLLIEAVDGKYITVLK